MFSRYCHVLHATAWTGVRLIPKVFTSKLSSVSPFGKLVRRFSRIVSLLNVYDDLLSRFFTGESGNSSAYRRRSSLKWICASCRNRCLSVFADMKLSQHEEMNLNMHDIHVDGDEMNLNMHDIHVNGLRELARQLSRCAMPKYANSSSLLSSISSAVLSSLSGLQSDKERFSIYFGLLL